MSDATGLQNEVRKLFEGIVAVFDDEVSTPNSVAQKLVQHLKDLNFPIVSFAVPPADVKKTVQNLHGASFVIFDWKYGNVSGTPHGPGASMLEDGEASVQIDSLRELLNSTYCPIFIVTQEGIDKIKQTLNENNITKDGWHARILFCHKSDLREVNNFFVRVKNWIDSNAPVCVLKKWERAAREAKFGVFSELEPYGDWPRILWNAYKQDGDDAASSLAMLLCKVVSYRMCYNCNFPKSLFVGAEEVGECESVGKIISAARYLRYENPDRLPISPGDVFILPEDNGCYYINIRAACDTIRSHDKVELYLIGSYDVSKLPADYDVKDHPMVFVGGQYFRWNRSFIIPYSIEGKTIEADFGKFVVRRLDSGGQLVRIGRLLPPFLTRLQQLFSAYMTREGLPALPMVLRKAMPVN